MKFKHEFKNDKDATVITSIFKQDAKRVATRLRNHSYPITSRNSGIVVINAKQKVINGH